MLKPNSEIKLVQLNYKLASNSLFYDLKSDAEILVISPGYPYSYNLYSFGFVHTSTKAFAAAGIKTEVFCNSDINMVCTFDKTKISYSNLTNLKQLIARSSFKRIIIHFINKDLQDIIDSVILYYGIKIYVYVHGAEVLYRNQKSYCTGYDGSYSPYVSSNEMYVMDLFFKKYSQNRNMHWIFVSKWMKEEAEKCINTNFLNYSIISNGIDIEIFKYNAKSSEHRLNIFTLRKYDNCNKYGLDLVINTILVLSQKKIFNKLNFCIYGDGELFEKFKSQILFSNVKFIQGFFTHSQISNFHKSCGIIFHPTRLDSMGCSSLEGVASGLVLVSSNTSAIPEFIDPSYGTLSNDIENPESYAKIIEDLYNNPDKFLSLSKKMSHEISSKYSRDIILQKELELFNNEHDFYIKSELNIIQEKLLTICVPAYNVSKYLTRCLNSILSAENKHLIEVLIINDGSKDNTQEIAAKFQDKFPNIVKVINQSNKGHGGAINTGINIASGKYFKIIDGDDWVDPDCLDKLLQYLNVFNDVDLVLNEFSYDVNYDYRINHTKFYNPNPTKKILNFNNVLFNTQPPILGTSTYRLQLIKDITLSENTLYVDMEFNTKAIINVDTVLVLDLPLYKYFIGRSEQSISPSAFKIKDHEKIIINLLDFIQNNEKISNFKKNLIIDKIIIAMLEGHYLRILQNKATKRGNLKFFDMVVDKIKSKNYAIDVQEKILNVVKKIKTTRNESNLKSLIIKLLNLPHSFAKFIYFMLNAFEIKCFNQYAKMLEKILLLPYKIVHYFYKAISCISRKIL